MYTEMKLIIIVWKLLVGISRYVGQSEGSRFLMAVIVYGNIYQLR